MREQTPRATSGLQCEECGRVSREGEPGWRAYLADDEPPEVAVFCGPGADREFGDA